jgi:hypothetical protein
VKPHLDSPPRRLVLQVSAKALSLFNELNNEATYGGFETLRASPTTAYRLGQAWGDISSANRPADREIDELVAARDRITAGVEQYLLESRKLIETYAGLESSVIDHRRRIVASFEEESIELCRQLAQLRPIHSAIQQCFRLVVIDPKDYVHMPPQPRKNREAVTVELAEARDAVFAELTHENLDAFVAILEATVSSKKYRRFVHSRQLAEIDVKLRELIDSLLVDSLILFTTED